MGHSYDLDTMRGFCPLLVPYYPLVFSTESYLFKSRTFLTWKLSRCLNNRGPCGGNAKWVYYTPREWHTSNNTQDSRKQTAVVRFCPWTMSYCKHQSRGDVVGGLFVHIAFEQLSLHKMVTVRPSECAQRLSGASRQRCHQRASPHPHYFMGLIIQNSPKTAQILESL